MDRNLVLQLIQKQLQFYGYEQPANTLSEATGIPLTGPSNELTDLLPVLEEDNDNSSGEGIDLITENMHAAERPSFDTYFITAHKMACRTAAFSSCGRYVATGSLDASLKVLDVEKMKARPGANTSIEARPVIRTMYDHTGAVNDVAFHPNTRVLASCSSDKTVKLYDLQKVNVKRGFRFYQDDFPVCSISFHPSGDYIAIGTKDGPVRMYDVKTAKVFVSKAEHHSTVHSVRFQENGRFYVSGGDSEIKVWDTITGDCVRNIPTDSPVASVQLTKNGKYILASLPDYPRLIEVASGKTVVEYRGTHMSTPIQAAFNFNEEYVIAGDEKNSIVIWCARTGSSLDRLGGHTAPARCIASSPVENGFMSCSEDFRARYWFSE